MNPSKLIIALTAPLVTATLTIPLTLLWSNDMAGNEKHHVLQEPLLLFSEDQDQPTGILPAGTSIRYIRSYPEGFQRFAAYINVGHTRLELEELDRPNLVIPLDSAQPSSLTTPSPRPHLTAPNTAQDDHE